MKKILYTMVIVLFTFSANAAEILIQDSVETGAGYKNDVFYSLHTRAITSDLASNWDLAFEILGAGYSVLSNGGFGVQVYHKKGLTAEDFEKTVDVEDVKANWTQLYNSTDTWSLGALNNNKDPENDFDLGWGEYSMATHSVYGTTYFVVKTIAGNWKKIVIDDLTGRAYNFRIANLDGSDLKERSLDKNKYTDKNFAYFSIDEDKSFNKEPFLNDWDLVFSKYINMEGPNKDTPYPVTGIRTNPFIKSIRVTSTNPEKVAVPDVEGFTDVITTIGSDWKKFDGTKYVISDDLVFFLYRSNTQKTFRVIFNGFGGSSAGKYYFKREEVATSVSDNLNENQFSLSIYPNIISKGENVSIISSTNENSVVEVFSSNGNLVWKSSINNPGELSITNLNTTSLTIGMYVVSISNNSGRAIQKLIVN